MSYQPFHISRIGAAHIRRELPCQDASASEMLEDACIAVVADGHGSRRHFRSDRGSAIACRVALDEIRAFLKEDEAEGCSRDERLNILKQTICDAWLSEVQADFEQSPWTEAELEEESALLTEEQLAALKDGTDAPIAYGSTLCAVFSYDGGWSAIQLGDGCFVRIGADGLYDWPMPESIVNEGNTTASLCMREPMRDFRHCWGTDTPAGLLVFTDGIEKVFPPQGKEIVSLLHWIWRSQCGGVEGRDENLARTLDMLTRRSSIGDDVSVAGIVDPEAEDSAPKASQSQKRQELERLTAQIEEIRSTIEYNKQRLAKARRNEGDIRSGAVEQLEDVIRRKQASVQALLEQAKAICEELGEPAPLPLTDEETEPELAEPELDSENTEEQTNADWIEPSVNTVKKRETNPLRTLEEATAELIDAARRLIMGGRNK